VGCLFPAVLLLPAPIGAGGSVIARSSCTVQRLPVSPAAIAGARRSSALVDLLTEREREVLRQIAQGHSNQQIADALIVSVGTIKKYLNNIFGKLGVTSHTQAAARAHALGPM